MSIWRNATLPVVVDELDGFVGASVHSPRKPMAHSIVRAACTLVLLALPLSAQSVRLVSRTPVSVDLRGRPLGEPHLVVHPSNDRHLLGAAMVHDVTASLSDSTRSRIRCTAVLSEDYGATWTQHQFAVRECFDPQVAITPSGRAVFSALGVQEGAPGRTAALLVFTSEDGGRQWTSDPLALGAGHDRPMLVTDESDSSRAQWVYVVSSLAARADSATLRFGVSVSRSRNGGRNFDPPVFLRPTTLMALAESPAVLADGSLMLPFVEPALGDGRTRLARRRSWLMQSRDGGFAFSRPLHINETCGSNTRPFSLSFLAVDASATSSRDRLYFACNQHDPAAVVVSTSATLGSSWTPALSVHSAPADSSVRRKVMATAVNATGVYGVVFVESGLNSLRPCAEDVYFVASVDGGRSFLPAELIAKGAACATAATNGSGFSGDYFGLATDSLGRFRVMYSGIQDTLLELHLATLEVAR